MSIVTEPADLAVGQALPAFERTPTTTQLVRYAGAEDDYMPVHFDHHYAVAAGQRGVINHGWLTFAIALQSVTSWLPPEIARVVRSRSRYLRPTYPGLPLVCRGTVTALRKDRGARLVDVSVEVFDGDPIDPASTRTATVEATFALLPEQA
ncbi:MaoC family dehydratase [Nocardioides sp.]|uniref:MaoC family dehydratase n=1 Tax=Nocardioides sp. TaxID=35761 RepID=UPI0026067600|nr:MaoC family dehydratase [Nocardioides sp.]